MAKTLLQETIEMLNETGLSSPAIAAETGLQVPWLNKLRAGDFKDPGVNKIELLNRWCRQRQGKAA